MSSTSLLVINDLFVRYGSLAALRNINLTIRSGELVFIAGPNGAGKSTLLKAIAGVVPVASGTIALWGKPVGRRSPDLIVAQGFTMVPEGREIFGGLSVMENLMLGAYLRLDHAFIRQDIDYVLAIFPDLKPRLDHPASLLSGGQQQMLAIGRALMTRAEFIAIDEPSLGLAPLVVDQIYAALLDLRVSRGLTFLIAEQSFSRAVDVDARLLLLGTGEIAQQGRARDLASGSSLEATYFGLKGEVQ